MKILALVPSEHDVNPGQRYRIEQWEPLLRGYGIELVYSPFSFPALTKVIYRPRHLLTKASYMIAACLRQASSVFRAHHFDLIYLFREAALLGPALLESLIAWQGIPVVYDFDDAIFVPYKSPSNSYLSYLKCFGKTESICRRARHVIVGNDYLRDYALQHNSDVTVIPTTIDTNAYRPELRQPRPDGVPVVGWTGSYSSYQYLELVFPALQRLAKKQHFRLVVVGTEAPIVRGVDVEFRPWRSETEVRDLADLDVGIMPLPDDPWSRGKCGLKALQYMALGIPPVVSPVGANREIVKHGISGFHAVTEDDWIEKLGQLLANRALRQRFGREARKTVEEEYSTRVATPKVYDVFTRAVSEGVLDESETHTRKVS